MRIRIDKEARERAVFLRFAESINGYNVLTIASRKPPSPDIYCEHAVHGPVAFELVELCSPVMAATAATGTEGYFRVSDPTSEAIRKKLATIYVTPYPIELLCYVDGRLVTPDKHIRLRIRSFACGLQRKYRRVWLLGRKGTYEVCAAV
jgi:hypothetical protein